MKNKKYSIFGAGASGLYTAWRLLNGEPAKKGDQGKLLSKGDVLELYDWGKYDFSKANPGTRPARRSRLYSPLQERQEELLRGTRRHALR